MTKYNNKFLYLSHIDGLRAIAVLAVIFYHLDVALVSGGFIGVDVFFVISGYLITNKLTTVFLTKDVSIIGFYASRVRRLFPAFFVCIVVTTIMGFFILSPLAFANFAESGMWAIFSLSNLYFLSHSGYFDLDNSSRVLLHTWSLSVEEQFYLIWPLLIAILLAKVKRYLHLYLLVFLIFLAIAFSYWSTSLNSNFSFFMMPSRVGEFLIGAILCWIPRNFLSKNFSDGLIFIGLLLIFGSFFFIDGNNFFPGVIVFFACFGTSLIIYGGNSGSLTTVFLSNAVITYIGRISYSLYLYHWPIIVFYKYIYGPEIDLLSSFIIIIFSFFLAILSYHYVESPFRDPSKFWKNNRSVLLNWVTSMFVITFGLLHIISYQGYPQYVDKELNHLLENIDSVNQRRTNRLNEICRDDWSTCLGKANKLGKKTIFILGDSHGPDALNILAPFFDTHYPIAITAPACSPMTFSDFEKKMNVGNPAYKKCKKVIETLQDSILYDQADYIVISSIYGDYLAVPLLDNFLATINVKNRSKIIVFGSAPAFTRPLPELVSEIRHIRNLDAYGSSFIRDFRWSHDLVIEKVAVDYGATFISKMDYFCEISEKICKLVYDGKLITYDKHHLSKESAEYFGRYLEQKYPRFENMYR